VEIQTRMKILFISPRFEGGIGGHAARLAKKLGEEGIEIKLMNPTHIPIKKLKNPSFAFFSTLKAIFKNESFDIVHAFNLPSAFAMRYSKSKKKILSIHGVYSEQIGKLHSKTTTIAVTSAESKLLKWADKLTTDSKTVQKQYKEKLDLDFECLYAPLEIEKFETIPDVPKKENQVVYIGRDSYEKGIDILKEIESEINGNVIYCTNLSWNDAMIHLKESSILVVPSRMESIPQVIKEAFFLKIPVIATKVGGIPEIITDKINGILISPNNPKELLKEINMLLKNKELSNNLSDQGYDYVLKNFTWKVLLPKYIEFYQKLIKN